MRAEVPEPQGERSTSPSAKTVTLRWCGPVAVRPEVVVQDRAVDAVEPPSLGAWPTGLSLRAHLTSRPRAISCRVVRRRHGQPDRRCRRREA